MFNSTQILKYIKFHIFAKYLQCNRLHFTLYFITVDLISCSTRFFESLTKLDSYISGTCFVNECEYDNGRCSQYCIDTYDSYYCGCEQGFRLPPVDYSCPCKQTVNFVIGLMYINDGQLYQRLDACQCRMC